MAIEPDLAVANLIEAGVAELSKTNNIFLGPRRSYANTPAKCVFVLATGGAPSRPIKGGLDEKRPAVTVLVRGDSASRPGSFQAGQQLAREVFNSIDRVVPTGYCECRCTSSHPAFLDVSDDGHFEWSIVVNLIADGAL